MRSCTLTWTLILIGVIIFRGAPDANAEDVALDENGFIRLDVGKTYVNLPSEGAVTTWFLEPYGETENRLWGESIAVSGGLRLRGLDTVPEDRTRLEAAVNHFSADAKNNVMGYPLSSPFPFMTVPLGFFAIDGSSGANGTLGLLENKAVLDTNYKKWGFDLKLAREVEVSGLDSLTLYTGLTYFNTTLSNDFNLVEDGVTIPIYLEDDIDTDYYGCMVGGDAAFPLGSDLVLDIGGRLELLYADANMTAHQNLNFSPPFDILKVDDSDDKLAGRVQAHMGLSYDLNPVVFGIGASASYLSYQPYAEHANTIEDSYTPSHIEDDHMFSCTFTISMNVAF
jgi:hypothetical protein